jgi:hypothetical protein
MALPVQLDLATALMRLINSRVTSTKRAHKVLYDLRASLTDKNIQPNGLFGYTKEVHLFPPEDTDTSEDRFDWEGYVANRSPDEIQRLVGKGVLKFEGRFLPKVDIDDIWKQHRFDFVASIADGTAVRFHPTSTGEAEPIVGYLADWVMQGQALYRQAVPDALPSTPWGFDIYRSQALDFVKAAEDNWCEAKVFRMNLFDGSRFTWDVFLERTPWGRSMLVAGVRRFFLVWVGGRYSCGGFYVKYGIASTETVIFPTDYSTCMEAVPFIRWNV